MSASLQRLPKAVVSGSKSYRWLALISLLLVSCASVRSGEGLDDRLAIAREDAENSIFFPLSIILPSGLRDGYAMREYIRSDAFGELDSLAAPEEAFDEIYFASQEFAHGDLENTLLAAAYGAFEHENIPVELFGGVVRIPLTHESHAAFVKRQSHLPKYIYHTDEDDRDKLQHYYATAWLKQAIGMDWLANIGGELVELGESLFVIGSSRDPRDLHANRDGIRFAIEAGEDAEFPPSQALTPNPLLDK